MADVAKLLNLYEELRENKSNFNSHLESIASVLLPGRGGFAGGSEPEGNRLYDEILDATPQQAARALASAIGVMMRPEGQKFFFVRPEDPSLENDDQARRWLEAAESMIASRAFENPKSRFRQAMGEADMDLVVFATAAVFAGENRGINGMLYRTISPKDFFIMTDDAGRVDGLIYRQDLNPRQARYLFGDKVGKAIRELEADEKKSNQKIEHIHVVIPRTERDVGPLNVAMPYTSIWIEVPQKQQLTESGFQEFPFAVPRFDTTSGEDWGRGPGMMALPDSNMLQAMGETVIIGAQKRVEPPLLAPDDGSFNAANTFAGGITYYDSELAAELGRIPIQALDTKADVLIGLEMIQDRREQVRNAFFKNILNLPVDGPQMTATEVIARDKEFLREMGGLFGRLESDYISPIVERTFQVLLRAKIFPPIPDVLLGQNVRFEYESPLKKVRQQIEAAAARQWKDDLLLLAQARPEVLDMLNADEYARFQADAQTVPMRLVMAQETVNAIREQRAQMQQAQMQMEAMESMAASEEKGSKAMKNAADMMRGSGRAA